MLQLTRSLRDYVLYLRRRQLIQRDWKRRHQKIVSAHPDYRRPAPEEIEARHLELWAPFAKRIRLETLRVCHGISAKGDARIVPEEVFAGDIERCLNPFEWAPLFSHKSLAERFFRAGVFPHTFLHCIAGEYFDPAGDPLDAAHVPERIAALNYPVVFKPNTDSSGGRGVAFPSSSEELRELMAGRNAFLVQEVIRQHPYFDALNVHGLNTLRVYTYRSVATGETHVLHVALRMGQGGSLDNETAGGIVCYVGRDGRLNHFAVDGYGARFPYHPDTRIRFAEAEPIPDFHGMTRLARELAGRLPLFRLAGWDLCLDRAGRWRCIEVNLAGHTIRFAQYAGEPFFGDFTGEVIGYCLRHPRFQRVCQKVY